MPFWIPETSWPADTRRLYRYKALGVLAGRLGEDGDIDVRIAAQDGGGLIEAAFSDETGRLRMSVRADYRQPVATLDLDLTASGRVRGIARLPEGRLDVTRKTGPETITSTTFDAGQPFDWRLLWPFHVQLMPWQRDVKGKLTLGQVDVSMAEPFDDGPVAVDVTTGEDTVGFTGPGGERDIACWSIVVDGPNWQEVAAISKGREGLLRFDVHSDASTIMIWPLGL